MQGESPAGLLRERPKNGTSRQALITQRHSESSQELQVRLSLTTLCERLNNNAWEVENTNMGET